MSKKSRFLKPGWWIVMILFFFVIKNIVATPTIAVEWPVVIAKWDSFQKVYEMIPSTIDRYQLRRYMRTHADTLQSLQAGEYQFSGTQTPATIIEVFNQWPQRSYERLTILEWRSIYDIDEMLVKKWYSDPGAYIAYVTDPRVIERYRSQFEFVQLFFDTKSTSSLSSLEWLLYPDTYHLDPKQDIIPQLVNIQLQTFQRRIWTPYQSEIRNFSSHLRSQGFAFDMGFFNMINLASIVEKEERNSNNKPTIVWLFLNRIQNNMRIDADITLCYGLKTGYEACKPSTIVRYLRDATNLYNTRVHSGLTPSPIANISLKTFESLLQFQKTNYLYYLHDPQWRIWYADTLEWHNTNKRNHL